MGDSDASSTCLKTKGKRRGRARKADLAARQTYVHSTRFGVECSVSGRICVRPERAGLGLDPAEPHESPGADRVGREGGRF